MWREKDDRDNDTYAQIVEDEMLELMAQRDYEIMDRFQDEDDENN